MNLKVTIGLVNFRKRCELRTSGISMAFGPKNEQADAQRD